MKTRFVVVLVILVTVTAVAGWHQFLVSAVNGVHRLAVIEDRNGHRIAVEPVGDDVWNSLVELYQSGDEMWIGGCVETFLTFRPDPNYMWGFRFKPGTIIVAEVTAEGLQATIESISENLDYWLDIGQAYVFAKVTDCVTGSEIQVCAQLSSAIVTRGDIVTISATVTDDVGTLLEGTTVTATIGNLEILFLLSDHGDGTYRGAINTSIVTEGTYEIAVTAQKEPYKSDQITLTLTVLQSVSPVTTFTAVVNGMRTVEVVVHVDISNGVTRDEAVRIAEATFIEVMGDSWGEVLHRLDTLTVTDTQITAHYTWGINENDMGHVFDMTADLPTLQITVNHCR